MADETERERRIRRQLVPQGPIDLSGEFESELTRLPGDAQGFIERRTVDVEPNYIERVSDSINQVNSAPSESAVVAHEVLDRAPAQIKKDIVKDVERGQLENSVKKGGLTGKFAEGLALWLPSIAAAAFGGTKALAQVAGTQAQILKSAAGPSKQDQLAEERLKVSQGQLEQRKKDIELAKERNVNLQKDRELGREERDLVRATGLKDKFRAGKRFQSLEGNLKDFDDIENLVVEGKKLPGALGSKIARAISGEVGVLTDQDIKRSQINPDIYNRVKNKASIFFTGEMSEENKQEVVKIVRALRSKARQKIRDRIEDFSASRSKIIRDPKLRETFKTDLFREHGVEPSRKERIEFLRNKEKEE